MSRSGDQWRAIEAYAAQSGFVIVEWYQDDSISGASIDARDGFNVSRCSGNRTLSRVQEPWATTLGRRFQDRST